MPHRLCPTSFVNRDFNAFDILPNELILDIFEFAVLESRRAAIALATVCKRASQLVDFILYRIVILSSPESISLLLSTVQSRHPSFFSSHVQKLAITFMYDNSSCVAMRGGQNNSHKAKIQLQLAQILEACPSLRTLVLPMCPKSLTSDHINSPVSPPEIVLSSYADLAPEPLLFRLSMDGTNNSLHLSNKAVFCGVTHLRIGDPTDGWYSPSTILNSFGPLLLLTHLQLSRRAHANADNDVLFVRDICEILQSRANLQLLVVTIYPSRQRISKNSQEGFPPLPEEDRDCTIWSELRELSQEDDRLAVVEGCWGGWIREWDDPAIIATGHLSFDFWSSAKERADKLKKHSSS